MGVSGSIPGSENLSQGIYDCLCNRQYVWENSQWLRKNIMFNTGNKELHESMDRYTDWHDITEVMVKIGVTQ